MDPKSTEPASPAVRPTQAPPRTFNFRRFFVRGLAIVLPTVLTITLLQFAYTFVEERIGEPINAGLREVVLRFTDWPPVTEDDFAEAYESLSVRRRNVIDQAVEAEAARSDRGVRELPAVLLQRYRSEAMQANEAAVLEARRIAFRDWWNNTTLLGWPILNLIGLMLAIALVYIIGALLTRSIGKRLFRWGEYQIGRVPLIGRVYPAFKQVTDFFFGDDDNEDRLKFNRVVGVEYPRKGIWSVGLVTGNTMQVLQDQAGEPCLTIFIPSSPTPFTGYVITVPISDTVELPITIEDALKFAVSGGVVVPVSQVIAKTSGTSGRTTGLSPGAAERPGAEPH